MLQLDRLMFQLSEKYRFYYVQTNLSFSFAFRLGYKFYFYKHFNNEVFLAPWKYTTKT